MRHGYQSADEKRRELACRELGCIACILDGAPAGERFENRVNMHHNLRAGKKIGEHHRVPLCDDHHVGQVMSYHYTRRAFRARYGDEDTLLAETNRRIGWTA